MKQFLQSLLFLASLWPITLTLLVISGLINLIIVRSTKYVNMYSTKGLFIFCFNTVVLMLLYLSICTALTFLPFGP